MKLVSLNVARPRLMVYKERPSTPASSRSQCRGGIALRTLNLDGDRQADLSVHGGVFKAVYVYPSEHYGYWRKELPEAKLPWGAFGENFTTEGLSERKTIFMLETACESDRRY